VIIFAGKDEQAPASPGILDRVSGWFSSAGTTASNIVSGAGQRVSGALSSIGSGAGSIVGGTVGAAVAPLNTTLLLLAVAAVALAVLIGRFQSAAGGH